MEISLNECKQILDTLPIGYYAGRRIDVSLDEEAETSGYNLMEDKIKISYPIIAQALANVPEDCDKETAIRGMNYHEVSHAILTPQKMDCQDIYNIFEDERIETLLRDYYHNVNFQELLLNVHGGKIPAATSPISAFFNAVRFGIGPKETQNKINKLIKKHENLNRISDEYRVYNYECDIRDLYNDIAREYEKNPFAFNPPTMDSEKENTSEMKNTDSLQSGGNNKKEGKPGEQQTEAEGNPEGKSEDTMNKGRAIASVDSDSFKSKAKVYLSPEAGIKPEIKKQIAEFQKTAEIIISNFNKKNAGGCGINAYSGVFNPRSVARPDYRFFERAMTTQGNNRFGKCHLNLIIDCSGSFRRNTDIMNGILAALTEIERKNRNFSIDVVFLNTEIKVCKTTSDRVFKAMGGNCVPIELKDIMMKLQTPQTCNYNIVLFDGDAMSDEFDMGTKERINRFRMFDMKQTTLISDPDNELYINNAFTSSKIVITYDYAAELIKHITRALTVAFA